MVCCYRILDPQTYGFEVDPATWPAVAARLVIDPNITLDWSSFIGGDSNDWVSSVEEQNGLLTVTGGTLSQNNFPITTGAYDTTFTVMASRTSS